MNLIVLEKTFDIKNDVSPSIRKVRLLLCEVKSDIKSRDPWKSKRFQITSDIVV